MVHDAQLLAKATPLARQYAATANRQVATVGKGTVVVTAIGAPPDATPRLLRAAMNDNSMSGAGRQVRLVLGGAGSCLHPCFRAATAVARPGGKPHAAKGRRGRGNVVIPAVRVRCRISAAPTCGGLSEVEAVPGLRRD